MEKFVLGERSFLVVDAVVVDETNYIINFVLYNFFGYNFNIMKENCRLWLMLLKLIRKKSYIIVYSKISFIGKHEPCERATHQKKT